MIQQLFEQYWGTVVLLALAVYVPTHCKASMAFARKIALQFIFAAEKRAEGLLLATGKQKLDWVVDKGYDLRPAPVRLVISKPLFRVIVQQVYDMAVGFAMKHQTPEPRPPSSQTEAPV